jgi:hypothetical protein
MTTTATAAAAAATAAQMKTEHGEVVPVEAVNAILLACCRLGDADRTFSTAAAIEKVFGVKKDLNSYNYLLHAAATIRKEEPPAAADSDDNQVSDSAFRR